MTAKEIVEADQIAREVWQESAIRAYKAKRFEETLNILAANLRDRGDVEDFIDNFCAEASPLRRTF